MHNELCNSDQQTSSADHPMRYPGYVRQVPVEDCNYRRFRLLKPISKLLPNERTRNIKKGDMIMATVLLSIPKKGVPQPRNDQKLREGQFLWLKILSQMIGQKAWSNPSVAILSLGGSFVDIYYYKDNTI